MPSLPPAPISPVTTPLAQKLVAKDDVAIGDSRTVGTPSRRLRAQSGSDALQHGQHHPVPRRVRDGHDLAFRVLPSVRRWEHVRSTLGRQGKLPVQGQQHTAAHPGRILVSTMGGLRQGPDPCASRDVVYKFEPMRPTSPSMRHSCGVYVDRNPRQSISWKSHHARFKKKCWRMSADLP